MSEKNRLIVVGNGWAALSSAASGVLAGKEVTWLEGTGNRLFLPLASFESGDGVELLRHLFNAFDVDRGETESGWFLREYRNKSFHLPEWLDQMDELKDSLWAPETWIARNSSVRFKEDINEMMEELRSKLKEHPRLNWVPSDPVEKIIPGDEEITIRLLSNKEFTGDQFIYADQWLDAGADTNARAWNTIRSNSELPGEFIMDDDSPKAKKIGLLEISQKWTPTGAVQISFDHEPPLPGGLSEGFMLVPQKDRDEKQARHIWGHLSLNGSRSYWTMLLTGEESEDNQAIGKKIRRIRQTLNRIFAGNEWVPEEAKNFEATVKNERVRLEEVTYFDRLEESDQPFLVEGLKNSWFISDGFGPSESMKQVAQLARQWGWILKDAQAASAEVPEEATVVAPQPSVSPVAEA